jgi:hypothetical protein
MKPPKLFGSSALIIWIPVLTALYLIRPWGLFFLNDDLIHVPLSAEGVFGQRNSIRIFNDFTLFLDSKLYGKSPTGYHLTNVLFHILSSIALFFFVKQLQKVKLAFISNEQLPLLTAVLFFCYPFHSESIFWIIGRGSSVSLFFFLLSLIFFLKKETHYGWGILSILPFIIALFTYESVWCFPIILFLLSYHNYKYCNNRISPELGWLTVYIFTFLGFLTYRHFAIGEILSPYETSNLETYGLSLLPKNIARLLIRSIAPPFATNTSFVIVGTIVALLFCLLLFRLFAKNHNMRPWICGLICCWVASVFPYITLGIDINGSESERYLYLPSVFVCLIIATFICTVKNRSAQVALTCIIFTYFLSNLYIASVSYRKASSVVQSTFSILNNLPQKRYVIFKEMPSDYKGAVMLRLGFEEGWKWLQENPNPDSFFVVSRSTNRQMFSDTQIELIESTSDFQLTNPTRLDGDTIRNNFLLPKKETVLIEYWKNGIKVYK